ncbi:MAG: hypothetical protein KAT54_00585, partial [Candidatus Marinimicrobia bacterium]|nr:hypothetical protein [Candidatus Neomarinimicrobiota bacterium]
MKNNMQNIQVRGLLIGLLFLSTCQTVKDPDLVELNTIIPDIVLDIRYATDDNFVGKVLYPSSRCFL